MITFLEGVDIYLRQLEESDADGHYVDWFNEDLTCEGNSHHVYPYLKQDALAYIKESYCTIDRLVLAIVDRGSFGHVGNVALTGIDKVSRSADFSIVVGYKYWGRGFGKEAATLIINHGFKAMNLHRVACATFSNNVGMIKLAESLGMSREGIKKEAAYKDGKYLDVVEFGILRKDWK
jgi:RimJ/RimL family protein N-acetyltransferase